MNWLKETFEKFLVAIHVHHDNHATPTGQALGVAMVEHAEAAHTVALAQDARIAALEAHAVDQLAAAHPDNADEESLVLSLFGGDRSTWGGSEIKKAALAVKLTGKSDVPGLQEAERVMAKYGWVPPTSNYNPADFGLEAIRDRVGPGATAPAPAAGGGGLTMSGSTDQAPGPSTGVTGGFIDPYGIGGDGKPGARWGGAPNQIEYNLEQARYWSQQPKYSGYWDGTLKDKNGNVIDYSKPGPRAGE